MVIWEEDDVLKVPTSSLFRDGDAWGGLRRHPEHGSAHPRRDRPARNGLEAQILSGLSADDQVIAYPSDAIADGVEVVARQ